MKNSIALLSITAACLLSSCDRNQHVHRQNNIISLIDLSPSRDSSVSRWYKETVKGNILSEMAAKDQFVALPVDYNSETSSEEFFKVDFSKNDYSNEFAGLQKDEIEKQNHRDSVSTAIQQFDHAFETTKQRRSQNPIKGTDLFGALKQAKKYIKPGCKNTLVIFSDMLQYTDKVKMNFEDNLNDTSAISQYLSRIEKIDLKGVQIVVLTGAQNEMNPQKFKVIRTFWERYLSECNAVLMDYSSGAVSSLERVITE